MTGRPAQRAAGTPLGICWLLVLPLALGALVDLPRVLRFGSVTLLGGLTIVQVVIAAAALLAAGAYPRRLLIAFVPYGLFLIWMLGRSATTLAEQGTLQHALVYTVFGLHVLLAGTFAAIRPTAAVAALSRGIAAIDVIGLGLAGVSIATGRWLIAPRALALLAIMVIAWHLAGWYHRQPWAGARVLLWQAVVLASLSRMALGVVLVTTGIVLVLQLATGGRRLLKSIPAVAAAMLVLGALAVSQADTLYERFFEGYTYVEVGGVAVSTSGRSEFWPVVIESAMRHPIVGGGIGSSQAALADFDPEVVGHPHNEYLRVWHDGGLIAVVLLFSGFFAWIARLGRLWRAATVQQAPFAAVEGAAFLMLIGMLLGAITDNGFDYVFLMGPAGIITGAALGLRLLHRDRIAPDGGLSRLAAVER
jgi:O-antigen ligase